ncbi:hypothetical protein H920_07911 [Fukomys damarensis]|uniref:Uncharacterized protein n=1 Tax=Fukomys damarensis TaxID=885580 RepID=A0A091E6F1_FUKDA|nr:hypothetical protein H920_07911 [Fukomys damarensis]
MVTLPSHFTSCLGAVTEGGSHHLICQARVPKDRFHDMTFSFIARTGTKTIKLHLSHLLSHWYSEYDVKLLSARTVTESELLAQALPYLGLGTNQNVR